MPYLSANEVNFIAFKLATEEYHNELYEQLKLIKGETKEIKEFDNEFFVAEKRIKKFTLDRTSKRSFNTTFLRNQIHHQAENGKADYEI